MEQLHKTSSRPRTDISVSLQNFPVTTEENKQSETPRLCEYNLETNGSQVSPLIFSKNKISFVGKAKNPMETMPV